MQRKQKHAPAKTAGQHAKSNKSTQSAKAKTSATPEATSRRRKPAKPMPQAKPERQTQAEQAPPQAVASVTPPPTQAPEAPGSATPAAPAASGGSLGPDPNSEYPRYCDRAAIDQIKINLTILNEAVRARRKQQGLPATGFIDEAVAELYTAIRNRQLSADNVRGWIFYNGTKYVSPNHTVMPHIAALYTKRLDIHPPLQVEEFYETGMRKRIGHGSKTLFSNLGLKIVIAEGARFGQAAADFFRDVISPLVQGKTPSNATAKSVTSDRFFDFLMKRVVEWDFPTVDFEKPPGRTCEATQDIESRLAELLRRYKVEPRVAPGVGNVRFPFGHLKDEDLQFFRISLIGRFGFLYLKKLLQVRRAKSLFNCLGLAGGLHMGEVVRQFTKHDAVLLDGVAPIALTTTESIESGESNSALWAKVIDPPGLRAKDFLRTLESLAGMIGHTFTKAVVDWCSPKAVGRDRLYPKSVRDAYFDELREEIQRKLRGKPHAIRAAMTKYQMLQDYCDYVDQISVCIWSLGHELPDDPFGKSDTDAVGDLLFHWVDSEGRPIKALKSVNDQVLGPQLELVRDRVKTKDLQSIVMASGSCKIDILLAAIRGGYCSTVLLDAHLAELLCEALEKEDDRGWAA